MRRWVCLVVLCLLLPVGAWAQAVRSVPGMETLPNDTSTGTTTNLLLKWVSGASGKAKAILAATTDTATPLFPCINGCGISGEANFRSVGFASCVFDNTTTGKARTFVTASTTTAGRCHQQDAAPSSGYVVGFLAEDTTTAGSASLIYVQNTNYSPGSGTGTGSVTSVAMTVPSGFAVAGSPITSSGTLAVTKNNESANTLYAGPTSGAAGAPGFRTLVPADLPAGTASGAVAGDLSGTFPNYLVVKESGNFDFAGIATPTTLSGNLNDYSLPTGVIIRFNGGAADRIITGFAAPNNGNTRNICNIGTTNAITLANQNTGSATPANRFDFGDDVTLPPSICKSLWYDLTAARWRLWEGTVPDYLKVRAMSAVVGDPGTNSPPLSDDNDTPVAFPNDFGRDLKILSVACYADVGTPTINVVLTGGTTTSVLTGTCTCGTAAWAACTVNGAPILHSFSGSGATCTTTPCSADMLLATAGGTAKYVHVKVKAVLQ